MSSFQETGPGVSLPAVGQAGGPAVEKKKKFWIPRRRVKARIRLADENVIDGELYASVERAGGEPGRIVDRLNNASEKFIPVAVAGRHILLNKSSITLVEVESGRYEVEDLDKPEAREIRVSITFSDSRGVSGAFFTCLPEAHRRALDFLNLGRCRFLALYCNGRAVLVNVDRIQHATELMEPTATT